MSVTILPFVQQVISRYLVTTAVALGLLGNLCNCIVFLKQRRRHETPCSVYLLSLSIFAAVYVVWANFALLYSIENIDPQTYSSVYCKLRLYGSHVLGLLTRLSVVFASADRYFITRTSVRIRSWSSVEMARKLIIINCLVCPIVSIHILVFMEIRNGVCSMFDFYKFFYPIYQFIIIGTVPPVLMSVFGFLTVFTLRQQLTIITDATRREHDLMRMLIAEILTNVFTSIPYSANLLYGAATYFVVNKSVERLEIEAFLNFITLFGINLLSVAPFYLFIISSKSFRRAFSRILIKWWRKYILRRIRVVPLNR